MFGIPGLLYLPDYLNLTEQSELVSQIDAQEWETNLSRRVQQYGYRYNHRASVLETDNYLGSLPAFLETISERMVEDGLFSLPPNQVILNEYEPGQGIGKHIDSLTFGPIVASLSLLSSVIMELKRGDEQVNLVLTPGSLLVLRGMARNEWSHGITARKTDVIHNRVISRQRRLSVTFRMVSSLATSQNV